MRPHPTSRRLQLPEFVGPAFPASVTIAFDANHGARSGPGPSITVEAGRRGTWVVTFIPDEPLPSGCRVAFRKMENEFRFDYIHQDYWPEAMGYVTVETGAGEPLLFECETALKAAIPAIVTLPAGLAAGETIVLRIGDQRAGGVGVSVRPASYDRARLETGVQVAPGGPWRGTRDGPVCVRVVACPPRRRAHLFAPSVVEPGDSATVVALPVDQDGNAVDAPGLSIDGAGCSPAAPAETKGQAVHMPVRLAEEGIARLTVTDTSGELLGTSNPIAVGKGADQVFWGEFHSHAYDAHELNVLNRNTHPREIYRYARDTTRLDFLATGTHIFRHVPKAVEAWWELHREAAAACDAPGSFVPFLGCEWRDAEKDGGDRNLVWRELDAPMPDPTWRIGDVYSRLHEQCGTVTPHVGGAIAVPNHHDPGVEWMCEMVSGHGQFEWLAQAYLQKGYRVGLIGGSDGHKGTPGHPRCVMPNAGRHANILRRRDAGWGGGPILGVYAEALDRESLWEAFRSRRVFATTGARALVDLRVNNAPMGAETEADGEVEIRFTVHGTAMIERVDLIRGSSRLARWTPGTQSVSERLSNRPPRGETYYYLRVEQADGEFIWSSPVWVRSGRETVSEKLPAWNEPEPIELCKVGENAAAAHLDDLVRYLETEELASAFTDITPYRTVDASHGKYAVFLCHLRDRRARIHWFYEFEIPRIRLEAGWVHYGRERIFGAPWATPLFADQQKL